MEVKGQPNPGTEEWESLSRPMKEEWESLSRPMKEEWESLSRPMKEEWESLSRPMKEEWESLSRPMKEDLVPGSSEWIETLKRQLVLGDLPLEDSLYYFIEGPVNMTVMDLNGQRVITFSDVHNKVARCYDYNVPRIHVVDWLYRVFIDKPVIPIDCYLETPSGGVRVKKESYWNAYLSGMVIIISEWFK